MEFHVQCYDETISVNRLFEIAETKMLSITVAEKKQAATDIESIVHQYMDDLDNLREQGTKPGLPTCYPDVDNIIGGVYKKELVITAGPAKSGKSTLRLNIARNQAKLGATIVIFITEMNAAKQGYSGIVDFEIKIPALLRSYQIVDTTLVTFYTEIK